MAGEYAIHEKRVPDYGWVRYCMLVNCVTKKSQKFLFTALCTITQGMQLKWMSTISNSFMASFPKLSEGHFSLTGRGSGVTMAGVCILLMVTLLFAALPSTAARLIE